MPALVWQIVIVVASFLIQAAMTPKQQQQPPAAFEDIDFPQVDEGTAQSVIFGDVWTGSWTVLAVGDYRVESFSAGEAGKK